MNKFNTAFAIAAAATVAAAVVENVSIHKMHAKKRAVIKANLLADLAAADKALNTVLDLSNNGFYNGTPSLDRMMSDYEFFKIAYRES